MKRSCGIWLMAIIITVFWGMERAEGHTPPANSNANGSVQTEIVEVTAGALNIRTGPSVVYRKEGIVFKGQRYVSLTTSSGWHKIWHGGKALWASGKYLKKVSHPVALGKVQIPALNVRTGPGVGHQRVGVVRKNQAYVVLSSQGNWKKIWYDGQPRWIYGGKGYIAVSSPSSPPSPPTSTPKPTPPQPGTPPPGTTHTATLSTGRLYLPSRYQPGGRKIDLYFMLHGHPTVVKREFDRAGKKAALVNVTFKGLSAVYRQPFSNQALFGKIVDEAIQKVAQWRGISNPQWGKIALVSFSAGYAGIREILQVKKYRQAVDAVILADSLYAGYIYGKKPNPHQLAPFKNFASLAGAGKKTMVLTHSSVQTYGYASTGETAEALRQHLGAPKITAWKTVRGKMTQYYRVEKGNFLIRGFKGKGKTGHTNHLQCLAEWLKEVSW